MMVHGFKQYHRWIELAVDVAHRKRDNVRAPDQAAHVIDNRQEVHLVGRQVSHRLANSDLITKTVQKNKPPDGKSAWIDMMDDGRVCLIYAPQRAELEEKRTGYVNFYRTGSIWSFLADIHKV